MTQLSFPAQLRELKRNGEDHEFYPTTNEILYKLGERLKDLRSDRYSRFHSFLDVGCGNAKVLKYAKELDIFSEFFAIEKSQTHLSNLEVDFKILGVDFWNVSFMTKEVSVIFCNPPYSEFAEWMAKLLKECPIQTYIYFVVPDRWEKNRAVADVIKNKNRKYEILGSFSFEDAEDRKARANVHLIEFEAIQRTGEEKEPFYDFFNENFSYPEPKPTEKFEEKVDNGKLVTGQNLIEVLVKLYDERMIELHGHYTNVCKLPHELLREFEISKSGLIESLQQKLKTEKKQYWERLFAGMKNINKLLTHKSRRSIIGLMNDQTGIDFNEENCYAVVMWIIKNANQYFDSQFIETYEQLMEYANVENYVSNKRVFTQNQFSYSYYRSETSEVSHIKLKIGHRIVLDRSGGLDKDWSGHVKLGERAANLIGDLIVIANNLGFVCTRRGPVEGEWSTSESQEYYYKKSDESLHLLFKVRCYQNGNSHFHFSPEIIHAFNITYGKLKGWVGNGEEAAKEMGIPLDLAEEIYNKSFKIGAQQLMLG